MSHQLSIVDGKFMSAANGSDPVVLKGVNWYGFNCQYIGMFSALDKNNTTIAVDFKAIVLRMKLLGLNAVRVPFSFQVLNNDPQDYFQGKKQWDRYQTQSAYSGLSSFDDELLRSVIPDWKWTQLQQRHKSLNDLRRDNTPPKLDWEPEWGPPGTANNYPPLNDPSTTVRAKFVWAMEFLARNGFYVIIEDHVGEPGKNDHDDTLFNDFQSAQNDANYDYSSCKWVQAWTSLVKEISHRGDKVRERLIVDFANEPDARKVGNQQTPLTWDALQPFYLAALQAIKGVDPNIIAFVEGTGQNAYTSNWGDGLVTDMTDLAHSPFNPPLSDPTPFFSEVVQRGFTNLALSPHVYPPSVADKDGTRPHGYFTDTECKQRWAKSFGDKNSVGFHPNGSRNHQKFAICIGEVGSHFSDWNPMMNPPRRVVTDQPFLETFKKWLNDNAIQSVLWWSWSGNSDTGGLVDDKNFDNNGAARDPDFWSVNWEALDWLQSVGVHDHDRTTGQDVPRIRGWYYSL